MATMANGRVSPEHVLEFSENLQNFLLQGNAGVGLTILTIILAVTIVLIVALSGIGVCERCHMESGGVYFLMSHVLGARIGGSVGVIYCFAQVSCM